MKIYNIYLKDPQDFENAVFIPEQDFSMAAFIFNFIWMAFHKMWLFSLVFFALHLATTILLNNSLDNLNLNLSYVINLSFSLLTGFFFYDLYQLTLKWKGFRLYDVICGENLEQAKYHFYAKFYAS